MKLYIDDLMSIIFNLSKDLDLYSDEEFVCALSKLLDESGHDHEIVNLCNGDGVKQIVVKLSGQDTYYNKYGMYGDLEDLKEYLYGDPDEHVSVEIVESRDLISSINKTAVGDLHSLLVESSSDDVSDDISDEDDDEDIIGEVTRDFYEDNDFDDAPDDEDHGEDGCMV